MNIFEWNENIPVTANNLNEMQNIINSNIESYSTNEIKIGKWINDKPIYRKVVKGTSINSDINTNIANCDDLIRADVKIRETGAGGWRNLPWLFNSGSAYGSESWAGGFYFLNGVIKFQVGSSLKNIDRVICIFEYTKTTD